MTYAPGGQKSSVLRGRRFAGEIFVYSCHHRVNNKGAQAVTVLNKIRKIRKYPNVVHDRINFGSVVLHLRGKSVAKTGDTS
jgi:hypothetical protein